MSEPGRCSVTTLLYLFDERDRVLLMRRAQEPNLGLWSPCGGKIKLEHGESPYQGAAREALEETGLIIPPESLRLAGLITERDDVSRKHWLMFLFEARLRIEGVPPPHREGEFQLFGRDELGGLPIPSQDRDMIWPLFWKHRGGFFSARCHLTGASEPAWVIEQGAPVSTIP